MVTKRIHVAVPSSPHTPYVIVVGEHLLADVQRYVRQTFPKRRIALLVDAKVWKLHRKTIETAFPPTTKIYVCPSGEAQKTVAVLSKIATQMLQEGLGRDTVLVNIGGGVTCDMGAFLASIYVRGIPFIQIATTLLCMVDASVGGKTGVDLDQYKNALGTFSTPARVYADLAFLRTLSKREYVSGLGECIKHGLLQDKSILRDIETGTESSISFVFKNILLKAEVVQQDFTEQGMRKMLNVGHTIGHALETYFLKSTTRLLHGEAVALGMLAELDILERRKILWRGTRGIVLRMCKKVGLPVRLKTTPVLSRLWNIAMKDKKNISGEIHISRLQTVGKLSPDQKEWTVAVTRKEFEQALRSIFP